MRRAPAVLAAIGGIRRGTGGRRGVSIKGCVSDGSVRRDMRISAVCRRVCNDCWAWDVLGSSAGLLRAWGKAGCWWLGWKECSKPTIHYAQAIYWGTCVLCMEALISSTFAV